MRLQQYVARQLSHPTGIVGKIVLGRLWNSRNAELNDVTLAQLELEDEDRVLDIGFGGGYLLDRIIPAVSRGLAAGLDASPVMAENCRQRFREAILTGKVDIRCGRAESLPFPDGRFNKVSSVNSIFYWSDPGQGIAEIFRVLDTGGKVVLTFTCKKDLERKGFVQYGLRTYNEEEVRDLLIHAGFSDVKVRRGRDRHREFFSLTGRK